MNEGLFKSLDSVLYFLKNKRDLAPRNKLDYHYYAVAYKAVEEKMKREENGNSKERQRHQEKGKSKEKNPKDHNKKTK